MTVPTRSSLAVRLVRVLLASVSALGPVVVVLGTTAAEPAAADSVDGGGGGYADLTFGGTAHAYTGTMTLPGGFPGATFTSTSRAGNVGVASGASTYLNTATGPGGAYGSSRNRPYLTLRPAADNLARPSVTTYTFDRPTPASGWMFTLGDIDADRVVISATDADGAAVAVDDLGFREVFNYCGGTPSPCPRADPPDVPSWDPGRRELLGNPSASDDNGPAGWFEPRVRLSSLTFTFYWRGGLPVYQTWFADRAHDVTGTVSGCAVAGLTVDLLDAGGEVVATTRTDDDGGYAFLGFTATTYDVRVEAPPRCEPAEAAEADATDEDVVVDVVLTPAIPSPTPSTPAATATVTSLPPPPAAAGPADSPGTATDVPTAIDGGIAGPPSATSPDRSRAVALGGLAVALTAMGVGLLLLGRRRGPS